MDKFYSQIILLKDLGQNEESITNAEGNIFNPILSVCSVSKNKNKFDLITLGNVDMLINIKPSFTHFFLKQTFPFPEFIQWCVETYC